MDDEHTRESKEEPDRELFQAFIKGNIKDVDNVLKEKSDSLSQRAKDAALILACRGRRKQTAKLLLNSGASFKFQDRDGNTALMVSAEQGLTDFAELLIRMGADVNAVNANGDTALILSINEGLSMEMLNVLIKAKADVDKGNKEGVTAMTRAIQSLDLDAVSVLLKSGASYNRELKTLALETGLGGAIGRLINCERLHYTDRTGDIWGGFHSAAKFLDIPSMKLFLDCKLDACTGPRSLYYNNRPMVGVMQIFIESLPDTLDNSHIEMIEAMFRHKSCFDANERNLQQILLRTIKKNGNFRLVEIILKQIVPQDKHTQVTWRCGHPLKACVEYGRCNLIPLLLDNGFGVDSSVLNPDDEENDAVHHSDSESSKRFTLRNATASLRELVEEAIRSDQPGCLKFFLNKYPLDLTTDLLMQAIEEKSEECVEILISCGANPNPEADLSTYSYGFVKTPLATAVAESEPTIVRILLENGANVNYKMKGHNGATCLKGAFTSKKCILMLSHLLDAGADINTQDDDGQTPLFYALYHGNAEPVAFLIRNGADLSIRDKSGRTALLYSSQMRRVDVTQVLLDAGADIDAIDDAGSTALHLAMERGIDIHLIETLISKRASLNAQNNKGFTALMMASTGNGVDAEKVTGMLVDAGADVNSVNQVDGVTTALSEVLRQMPINFREKHVKILTILLQSGASLGPAPVFALHGAAIFGSLQLVQLLIESGFGPLDISGGIVFNMCKIRDMSIRDTVKIMSPFLVALLQGKASIVRYLSELNFFTKSDLQLSSAVKGVIRNYLVRQGYVHCLQIWDDLYSQPWTLFRLSFGSVSAAIGGGSNRREATEQTPLPPLLKRKLNFQELDTGTYTECEDDLPEDREAESPEHVTSVSDLLLARLFLANHLNQSYHEPDFVSYSDLCYVDDDSDDYDSDW